MLLSATARKRALLLFGYSNARLPIRGSAHPMTPEVVPPDLKTPPLQGCDRSHANVLGGLHGKHGVRGQTVAPLSLPILVCGGMQKKKCVSVRRGVYGCPSAGPYSTAPRYNCASELSILSTHEAFFNEI